MVMRVEPFNVDSVVHVLKRSGRGMDIVRDESDRWRFVRILYLLNDEYQDPSRQDRFRTDVAEVASQTRNLGSSLFHRPEHWPQREPLVSVLAWTLMPNHAHLLLQEIREGGVSKFMQRLGCSMSNAFNQKYEEKGSIFQGAYKSRTVNTDSYLRYVLPYITVKNVFELFPGGLSSALKDFESAWQWASTYPFSSFQTHAFGGRSPIIDHERLSDLGIRSGTSFKRLARDMIFAHVALRKDFSLIMLEDW